MDTAHAATLKQFEDALTAAGRTYFELTLFVGGASDLSTRAISDARRLCDEHLDGRYHLSVVDLHKDPGAILGSRVLAAPTLVRSRPLPVRILVGDLSHTDKVLQLLGARTSVGSAG